MNKFQPIFDKQKDYFNTDATKSYEWPICFRTSMWSSSFFRSCLLCFSWPTVTFLWRLRYQVRLSSISFAFTYSIDEAPAAPVYGGFGTVLIQ